MNAVGWTQLRGMMNYEFRLHWRRRSLLIVVLAVSIIVLFTMVLLRESLHVANGLDPELSARAITATIIFSTWAPIGVSLAIILPIMVADTIPLDKQLGMRDTLDSLPLTHGIYVMGKLLGVWAAVLVGMLVVMLVTSIAWWVVSGPYDIFAYMQMWLVGVAWISILNSGLGVLVSAAQPNRRRAILIAILFSVVSMIVFSRSMQGNDFLGIISPMRGAILSYYLFNTRQNITSEVIPPSLTSTPESVVLTIIAGIIELILIGFLVVAWMRYQENKA